MSAIELRRAVDAIRTDIVAGQWQGRESVIGSIADWLEDEAERVERCRWSVTFGGEPMFPPGDRATATARAYLAHKSARPDATP